MGFPAHYYRNESMKRNNARKRTVKPISPTECLVTGGDNPHTVIYQNGQWICDCPRSQDHCCHIIAIELMLGIYSNHGYDRAIAAQKKSTGSHRRRHHQYNRQAVR